MSIAGYRLKINGGVYVDRIIDVGNVLTYEIDELTYGVVYGVQVASYDADGVESYYSNPEYLAPLGPVMLVDDDGDVIADEDGNAIVSFS